jgi:hypothetical protein
MPRTPLAVALLGLAATPAAAAPDAQGSAEPAAPPTVDAAEQRADAGRVHLTIDLAWTDKYYFRGLLQEDEGFIAQPTIELGLDLHDAGSWSLGAYGGVWGSFHDEKTGASDPDDSLSVWYEVDFYAGLTLTTGRLSTDLAYTHYASPNDAFDDIDELILTLSWDDTGWLDAVTLAPYATLAFEIGGAQGDGGDDHGIFLAVGMEPSHTYADTPIGELTLSLPIEAGFSLDDYYEGTDGDESFGYFTVGLAGSVALPAPQGFGAWSFNAGVDYLVLGDTTEAVNNDESSEWIVHAGMTFEF